MIKGFVNYTTFRPPGIKEADGENAIQSAQTRKNLPYFP